MLMSESTQPGPTWLTAMPSSPHSRAITPTRWPTACLEAPYTPSGLNGITAFTDEMTTMLPPSP